MNRDRDDDIDVVRARTVEEEVPLEKYGEKDVHHPVDDNVTVLGTNEDNADIATKA